MGDLALVTQTPLSETRPGINPKCTARSKRHGGPCGRPAMNGSTVCYHHGGKTPSGIAAPAFKHGGRSKHLPTRLAARFHEAEHDQTLLHLRSDVALLETRLTDVLDQLDDQTSSELLEKIKNTYDILQKAKRSEKQSQIDEAEFQLREAIFAGYQESQNWREIRRIIQERVTVSKEERARLNEMQQTLSVQEANVLLGMVVHAISTRVTNKEERALLAQDLANMTRIER